MQVGADVTQHFSSARRVSMELRDSAGALVHFLWEPDARRWTILAACTCLNSGLASAVGRWRVMASTARLAPTIARGSTF